ncbi:MAG: serine/threonine protein kinase, partial [Myxococcales bacterium]|nr:serine/threonine protein kinase [Myxococcales bacterium]
MSGSLAEGDLAHASTLRQLHATGVVVAAARRRVLAGLFGPDQARSRAGRFDLRAPLGQGAFGTVWRAFDPVLQREVAVKLLDRRPGARHDDAVRRFLREARAVASLCHPNIVEVFDCGELDGTPFLAMELVDGGSVDAWLREPRPWPEVVEVFLGAARGLAAAHRVGIVHRDFKPANILRGSDGRARVADFGLAVLASSAEASTTASGSGSQDASTESSPFAGTPAFMAPEQHTGDELDARADVYAFCASLYAALEGRPPFAGDSMAALVRDKRHQRLVAPLRRELPRRLRRVVLRGLEPEPRDRWPSMEAVVEALQQPRGRARARLLAAGAAAAALVGLLATASEPKPGCESRAQALVGAHWDAR